MTLAIILYTGAIGLLVIGLAGVVMSSHLFRMLLGLVIAEAGANLLLILAGYRWGGAAPIWQAGQFPTTIVDPVPQAMVLTAIVIGVGVQALAIALLIRHRHYSGTLQRTGGLNQLQADLDREAGVRHTRSSDAPTLNPLTEVEHVH